MDMSDTLHMAQLLVNGSSRIGTKGLAELLSCPAATAALASALCSILKRATGFIAGSSVAGTESDQRQAPQPARADRDDNDSSAFLQRLSAVSAAEELLETLGQLSRALEAAVQHTSQESTATAAPSAAPDHSTATGSSSSRAEQVRASAVFLLVLLHQRLLGLSTAAAAALGTPEVPAASLSPAAAVAAASEVEVAAWLAGVDESEFAQLFMANVVNVMSDLYVLPLCLQLNCAAAAETSSSSLAPVTAADAELQCSGRGSSSNSNDDICSGSSSSSGCSSASSSNSGSSSSGDGSSSACRSSHFMSWQYLLRLHESRKLLGTMEARSVKQNPELIAEDKAALDAAVTAEEWVIQAPASGQAAAEVSSDKHLVQLWGLYRSALGFCRTLAAVAPLPVVCN
jgi:uncharacterized membrane protein YgcG